MLGLAHHLRIMAWRGLARVHHGVGRALEWCGWLSGAAHAYRDALRRDPDYAVAHYRLGEVRARGGAWDEASDAFAEATRLRPQSVEFQGNLVLALHRAGRGEELVQSLRRLTHLRPQEGELYVLLGAVLRKLKRHDEAIRAYRWAVRLEGSPTAKRFFLGEALLGPRGWLEAVRSWREAKGVLAALPVEEGSAEGRSPLNARPGGPVSPPRPVPPAAPDRSLMARLRRLQQAMAPAEESFEAALEREEATEAILHGYSEPRTFPGGSRDRRGGTS